MLRRKIEQQIEDIRNPLLFLAYQCEGHAIDRHVLDDRQLLRAIYAKRKPQDVDDIVMVTRFKSKESALNLIADTLLHNIDAIEKWLLSSSENAYEATCTYTEATGDGLAKNTDWSKPIPVHGVRVVILKNFRLISRSFIVVTAYPQGTCDDIDAIYERIDDYISKKNK